MFASKNACKDLMNLKLFFSIEREREREKGFYLVMLMSVYHGININITEVKAV